MASRSEESKAESGSASGERGAGAGAQRRRPSADAVERALAEVSQTLDRLKQVRSERVEAEARFKAEIKARDDRLAAMQVRLDELEANADAMAKARADAMELEADRDGALEQIELLQERLDAAESEVQSEREARAAAESLVEAAQQAESDELERARAELAEAERRLAEQAAATEQASVASSALRAERDEALRRSEELAEGLRAAEQDLALSREAMEGFASKLAEAEELRGRVEELTATLEASRRSAAEWEELAQSMESRAVEAEESVSRASAEAAENARVLESTLERQQAELERLTLEASELRESSGALSAQLAEARAAESATAERFEGERQKLASALEHEREQVLEMEGKLDLAADRIGELQQALAEREAELEDAGGVADSIAALTSELAELRAQLDDAERERDELRERGEGAGRSATESVWDDPRLELRRRRLKRARRLLREHAAKADQVEEVLAQRLTQCEDVLSRRRELVQAREVIERAHKRVLSTKSRSGAAATVFFGLGTIAVLAALSWAVVTRTFPARYAAAAVLAAEFTESAPTPEALASWEEFHEKLLLDPQLMSRAAERLAQRGFVELSQPAALKLKLEQDMTWSVPEPGKISFELRGLGQESTARALDSYLTSLVAQSSSLRQRRSESSTTVIAEPVRAGTEPIEDPRLAYAGIGLGGGVVVCLTLWLCIWRRMVKTKSAFENSTAVDHLLEEARWVDPIQKIIESPGDGSGSKAA
ncbi:MAG: hypothetical protein ACF8R9_15160 [Phycisphaerales bacterium JB054]